MANIIKNLILQGVINIEETVENNYTYNLVLPPQDYQTSLPHALDNQVIEEVYIHVNHSFNTSIFLPKISLLKKSWNPKIYVTLTTDSESIPETFIFPNSITETINGQPQIAIPSLNASRYFHAVENNMWMCLGTYAIG